MASNNSSLECFEKYDNLKYRVVVGLRSGFAAISCLSLLAVISIIVLFRKYRFTTQRLILYLAISSFSKSLIAVLNVTGLTAYKNDSDLKYCIALGFFEQVTSWWELAAIMCILLYVFIQVVFGKPTNSLEILYLALTYFIPLTYSWIPFVHNSFGPKAEFCWIRHESLEDCTKFRLGIILGYSLYGVPFFIICVLATIMLTIALLLMRWKRKKWVGKYDPEAVMIHKMIESEIKPLIFYPLIFLIFASVPLCRRLYELKRDDDVTYYVLTVCATIVSRFQGIVITLVFVFDRETRHLLTWQEIYGALVRCYRKEKRINPYPFESGVTDSASQSLNKSFQPEMFTSFYVNSTYT